MTPHAEGTASFGFRQTSREKGSVITIDQERGAALHVHAAMAP